MSDLSKPKLQFFAYSEAAGFEKFDTPEEAAFCAAENLRELRTQAVLDGWWDADAESIYWGQISEHSEEFCPDPKDTTRVDYALVPAV